MRFTVAYSLMFLYILATIVFWGYSLNKQNKTIYTLEKDKLALMHQTGSLMEYEKELDKIHKDKMRRTQQYTGEGSTFALIILFTACIVYYAYYRQRRLAKLQENFMLSVTHELKTPIAGIKLNMQTLEKRVLADDIRNIRYTNARSIYIYFF